MYNTKTESIWVFWISWELVAWSWCNLAPNYGRTYWIYMSRDSPVGLLHQHIQDIEETCVLCNHCIHSIKFFLRLAHSSAYAIQMTEKAFGDDSMIEVQIKFWYQTLKPGLESTFYKQNIKKNVEHMWVSIKWNQWLTVQELEFFIPGAIHFLYLLQVFLWHHSGLSVSYIWILATSNLT